MWIGAIAAAPAVCAAVLAGTAMAPASAASQPGEGYPGPPALERLSSRSAAPGRPPFPAPARRPARLRALPSPRTAPAVIEGTSAYVPQTSCDPTEKPGITAFKRLVLHRYPASEDWGSSRDCAADGTSEHLEGRAWDWHVDVHDPSEFLAAGHLLTWLTAVGPDRRAGYNARRLGIMYIIYNRKIWGSYRMSEGWRKLNSSNPHTDHVHFSFSWNGAMKRTSFWRGKRARAEDYGPCRLYAGQPAPLRTAATRRPCPAPGALPPGIPNRPVLWRGSVGRTVGILQARLGITPVTSFFGQVTQRRTADYQAANGLPVTGAADAVTRAHLGLG